MSSRVGSGLALTAALLIAVASLPVGHLVGLHGVSSWWSGHPTFSGETKERELVTFHLGLVKSAGCFSNPEKFGGGTRECTDDDYNYAREHKQAPSCGCQPVALTLGFRIAKYTAFGFAMVLAVALFALGLARRQGLAKIVLVFSMINAIATIVLLVIGPSFRDGDASVPIAMVGGLGLHFLGMGLSIVSSLVALMPARSPKLVVGAAPGWTPPVPAPPRPGLPPPPQPQPVDVLALLHDDTLRPASLGPEPMLPSRPSPVASPGGALPGPSGPLGMTGAMAPQGQPLFSAAPQLRPLYEADGSNGLPSIKQPELPTRGPTPISMSAVNALTGNEAPVSIPPPPPPKGATLPPPLRNKPPTGAPPMPPIPMRDAPRPTGTTQPPPLKGNQTMMGNPVLPMPPISVPAVIPPIPGPPITKSTLAGPPGMTLPATRPETDADGDGETADFEKQTLDLPSAIDRDAFDVVATIAGGAAPPATLGARDPEPTPVEAIDASMLVTGDSTSPSVPFDTITTESLAGNTDVNEDLETVAREKIEARPSVPVMTSAPRPAKPTGAQQIKVPMPAPGAKAKVTTPPPAPGPAPARIPGAGYPELAAPAIPAPPPVSQSQQIKVPISTAPESLPPPKEAKPAAVSGPSPACPQCEAPMAWVEEHLRFYCKSCRMYF